MLIDTHSHIYLSAFESDREEIIERATRNKVQKILLPNIDSNSIQSMLDLADKYNNICFPMMGLHPTSVKENYCDELKIVDDWLNKEKFYGIGETGIDLYWDTTFIKEQINSFSHQIELAKKYNLPVVIHVRNSFKEVFNVLDELHDDKLKGVFHCFTGDAEQAKKIISYGFKMGIGGVLTFKNSNLGSVLKNVDLRHIVLETDSPYLAPVPFRGKRNESSYIKYTAEKLAEIKNIKFDDVANITTQNALQLFNLD